MSKIAFIYPGQGAQKAGMAADFYEKSESAREVFDNATSLLNIDMKKLCFDENDKLDITEYTQAALVTTYLAMTKVVEEAGLTADVTAGLSLGEYAAIAVAGGMSYEAAIKTVRCRGILMQNTVKPGVGAMSAIIGMNYQDIEKVIADIEDVTIANYNCPGQIVITGKIEGVNIANEKLKEAGARRCVLLNVSGPFHSPLLKEAGENLRAELDKVEFTQLKIPYYTNVTAERIENISETKDLLEKQVYSSVRWQQSIENMIADGVDTFVEIGPGKTLAGFMKKINKEVKVYNIQNFEDVEPVIKEIKEC